jgi:hypothetical protein
MYQDEQSGDDSNKWVIAFEDVLIHNGEIVVDTKPFLERLQILITLVSQLQRSADPAHDPGTFAVKPWFPVTNAVDELRAERFYKQPSYLLIRFLPKDPKSTRPDSGLNQCPFFMKIHHDVEKATDTPDTDEHPEGSVFLIRKNPDTMDPDQYDLHHPSSGKHMGRACIRTLHNSLWIRSLENDAKVWCRWLKEHSKYEPYADAVVEARVMPVYHKQENSVKQKQSVPRGNHRGHRDHRAPRGKPREKVECMLI